MMMRDSSVIMDNGISQDSRVKNMVTMIMVLIMTMMVMIMASARTKDPRSEARALCLIVAGV